MKTAESIYREEVDVEFVYWEMYRSEERWCQ